MCDNLEDSGSLSSSRLMAAFEALLPRYDLRRARREQPWQPWYLVYGKHNPVHGSPRQRDKYSHRLYGCVKGRAHEGMSGQKGC